MGESAPNRETPSVRAEALSVVRGGCVLFEGLSFSAAPGAYVEVRGPNGAGKTSLLRALAGLLKPAAGRVVLADPEHTAHLIGHRDGLKPQLDARAHLHYWAGLFGGQPAGAEPALQQLGLAAYGHAPARALSRGQARRLALGRLLVAPRPIWLLDEPGANLDESGRALIAALIGAHRQSGGVVIAALHEPLAQTATQSIVLGSAR